MKSNHCYNHSFGTRYISDSHIEGIRESVKVRRENGDEGADIKISPNGAEKGDFEKPETKIKNYLTQLNVLIIYSQRHGREISINMAVKNLQQRLGKDLSSLWSDLILFVAEYNKSVVELENQCPYPWSAEMINFSNYGKRAESFDQLKKDGVKRLLELVGQNGG